MEDLLGALKALGEPTRLRIVVALRECELTVGELCQVLGQTQPRVSRHLKLLTEAGLLDRHAQGTSAYYRTARDGRGRALLAALRPFIDGEASTFDRDQTRLARVREARVERTTEWFASVAADWERLRELHVADDKVEAAMLDAVADLSIRDLVDLGTGTGRVLEVFADRIDRGLGVDMSHPMLDLARSRLDQLGHRHCSVRHGDVLDLDLDAGAYDVAVLHHVLHFVDDPAAAVHEAARTIRADGRLVVVDFAAHDNVAMRDDHHHRWLGFTDDDVAEWCREAGLIDITIRHLRPVKRAGREVLTTTIWVATQHPDAPSLHPLDSLKAAS